MRGSLDPALTDFIATINEAAAQAKQAGVILTPELARANLEKLSAFVTKAPEVSYVADKVVEHQGQAIPVRVYSPDPDKALPVVIYFHGGGHMCGDVALYDPMCRKFVTNGHCVVISVEYRLAPEFPFPIGLNDAEAAVLGYKTVLEDVSYSDELIVGGDSAGGAICTSLTMRMCQGVALNIDKQFLIYPSVDYTGSTDSFESNGTGYLLENTRVKWYFDHYFGEDVDRKKASPLFNQVNKDAPSTLIITAGCDPLRDEGLAYASKLQSAGVLVQHKGFSGMIHAFMNIEDLVPNACAELHQCIGNFIQQKIDA